MNNLEVATVFYQIADMLEIKGENRYRVAAYRRAAETLENLKEGVEALWREGRLRGIPGVGEAISAKIEELLTTGRLRFHERLKEEIPLGVVNLLAVPGVGPRTAKLLYERLGIDSLEGLEQAAQQGLLRGLPGLGERSQERILKGVASLRRRSSRIPLAIARPEAAELLHHLVEGCPQAQAGCVVGSIRRWQPSVGNLNLLCTSRDPQMALEFLSRLPGVKGVVQKGPASAQAETALGHPLWLAVAPQERYGASLAYWTGSKAHNHALEELALERGLHFDAQGLWGGERALECASEEEFYQLLGLPFIPPELREDEGEIEAARKGRLPSLVQASQIAGDLHVHTDWSDGASTILEMAEAARRLGHEYLVISDHTQGLGVARGLDPERLEGQRKEIARLNSGWPDFQLLAGAEVEIRADGSLDLPDEVLAKLDVVVASLHSGLDQDPERITARALKALRHPYVHILGHPSGRLLGQREASALDLSAAIQVAAEEGKALEVNAQPNRLDLEDRYIHQAIQHGVKLAIGTDAHRVSELEHMAWGLATARRGWARAEDVLNTMPLPALRQWLKRG